MSRMNRKIVGALVRTSATHSPKEAQLLARNYGLAKGTVRKTSEGFVIGSTKGRRHDAAQNLTVFVQDE